MTSLLPAMVMQGIFISNKIINEATKNTCLLIILSSLCQTPSVLKTVDFTAVQNKDLKCNSSLNLQGYILEEELYQTSSHRLH